MTPFQSTLLHWLALWALAMLAFRVNRAAREKLRQLCAALMRNEVAARTLELVITLPAAALQALIVWLAAGLLNIGASLRGWRAAAGAPERWHSPFLELPEQLPGARRVLLLGAQHLASFTLLVALSARAQPLYVALLALDSEEILAAGRTLLAAPAFWLWSALAFGICLRMLPASQRFFSPAFWLAGLATCLALATIAGLASAAAGDILRAIHETLARAILAALALTGGFLAMVRLSARLLRTFARLRGRLRGHPVGQRPHSPHQPEAHDDQADHQAEGQEFVEAALQEQGQ